MRGLGRLIALPWLLVALAVQSLAPAEAATMRPDPAAPGICSAHALGGATHRDPADRHDHDCCAFACALANLAAIPPPPTLAPTRVAVASASPRATPRHTDGARASPLDQPRARGPPAGQLTT